MTKSDAQSHPPRQMTITARGNLLSLDQPLVMGILNLTPDSFHPGSRIGRPDAAVSAAERMIAEGAAVLDIGAASSRPGSEVISVEEELRRLMPALEKIILHLPNAIISVDTWRAEVARRALDAGAHMINDITAGLVEPEILDVTANARACYIAMHMRGAPGNMPVRPEYDDLAGEVLRFFAGRIRAVRDAGVTDLILDPGFGFGKTAEQNFVLLKKLHVFRFLEVPVLVGLSRKSMVWRTLNITAEEALNGTTALHMIALLQGIQLLRVHDVRAAMEVIRLFHRYQHATE